MNYVSLFAFFNVYRIDWASKLQNAEELVLNGWSGIGHVIF
jgi:hypothetical protein